MHNRELGCGSVHSGEQQRYASALRGLESGEDPDIEQILTQVIYNYEQSNCSEGSTWGHKRVLHLASMSGSCPQGRKI